MTFHALHGLGDDSTDPFAGLIIDGTGGGGGSINTTDGSTVTVTSTPINFTDLFSPLTSATAVSSGTPGVSGNGATGFSWGNLFGSLIGAGTQVATSTVAASNQAKTATANAALLQGQAAAVNAQSGATLASLTPFLLLGGGLLLIMSMRKGK